MPKACPAHITPAKQYDQDIEKAKQIVEENGLTGTKLKIITNDNPSRVQVAQIIQSNLKEIGLELEIEVVAWATYLQDLANANFEMKLGGWSGGTRDSDNILSLYITAVLLEQLETMEDIKILNLINI